MQISVSGFGPKVHFSDSMSKFHKSHFAFTKYAVAAANCLGARAAISAGPKTPSFKSHSTIGVSVGSTASTVNVSKGFSDSEIGAAVRNRANSAVIVCSEKSRVQSRKYARLAMAIR